MTAVASLSSRSLQAGSVHALAQRARRCVARSWSHKLRRSAQSLRDRLAISLSVRIPEPLRAIPHPTSVCCAGGGGHGASLLSPWQYGCAWPRAAAAPDRSLAKSAWLRVVVGTGSGLVSAMTNKRASRSMTAKTGGFFWQPVAAQMC